MLQAFSTAALARAPSALDLPLHPDLVLVAKRGRDLLHQADAAAPATWQLPLAGHDLAREAGKIGARIVRHGRYVVFQLAEVAVPRALFAAILRRIDRLRGPPMVAA